MISKHFVSMTGKTHIAHGDSVATPGKGSPLSSVARGKSILILDIPQGRGRTQLIRLGLMTGEVVKCVERLPGGTVVIEKDRQEIAIGSSLAGAIRVAFTSNGEVPR